MDSAQADKRRFYIPALDGIRGIALLLVFASHVNRVAPGGLGVTIFFFLSGYLITSLLRLEGQRTGTVSLREFYLRRSIRILPPLYITLAITGVLSVLGIVRAAPAHASAYLAAALFYMNYFLMWPDGLHAVVPQGVLLVQPGLNLVWSLSIEEHFYLVFPLLYLIFLRAGMKAKRQVWVLLAGCGLALAWRSFLVFGLHARTGTEQNWTHVTTDCRFDSILWGCLLAVRNNAWFGDRSGKLLARRKGWMALLGCAGLLVTIALRNLVFRETVRYSLQGMCLYLIFYYCIATSEQTVWMRVLENKTLRWIGAISYTLYLCHLTFLSELQLRYSKTWWVVAAAAGLSVLYAWGMRAAVEQPLKRLRVQWRAAHAKPREIISK